MYIDNKQYECNGCIYSLYFVIKAKHKSIRNTIKVMFIVHCLHVSQYGEHYDCILVRNNSIIIIILAKYPPSAGFPSPSGGVAPSAVVKEKRKKFGAPTSAGS